MFYLGLCHQGLLPYNFEMGSAISFGTIGLTKCHAVSSNVQAMSLVVPFRNLNPQDSEFTRVFFTFPKNLKGVL